MPESDTLGAPREEMPAEVMGLLGLGGVQRGH